VKRKRLFALSSLVSVTFLLLGLGPAIADSDGTYGPIALIPIPGAPLTSFDISWVDYPSQTFYLADRSNNQIDRIDASTDTLLSPFGTGKFVGFRGKNSISGPNGILEAHNLHQLWVGDGDSRVHVIDARSGEFLDTISTAKCGTPGCNPRRSDELAYDPKDHLIVIANNEDVPAYLTFISTEDHTVQGYLDFPAATDGLEQPVWDNATHMIYQAVPETPANPFGEIDVIDPQTRTITDVFPIADENGSPLNCGPHGLAIGPHFNMLVGCGSKAGVSVVIDIRDGSTVAVIRQVGGSDEVWYNPGDRNYYLAARNDPRGPALGIIDADSNTWIQNVPTIAGAHSVAANRANGHIYVPMGPPRCVPGCIGVFARTGG
jgi:DNA-binding beta-propeller fold protein YncE